MKKKYFLFLIIVICFLKNSFSQEEEIREEEIEEYYYSYFLNDNTKEGQIAYVEEILAAAGYIVDDIIVYQTLPNNARVFRVIANDSLDRGFIFIRWDKEKQENYIANKLIDPGVYYNLKAAEKILRTQTTQSYFTPDDPSIQPIDQPPLKRKDINALTSREENKKQGKKNNQ